MLRAFSVSICLLISAFPITAYGQQVGSALSPKQLSVVDSICTKVMGLSLGESFFAGCKKVLSQFLMQKAEDRVIGAADHACSQRGLVPGSAAFSTCVLDNENDPLLDVRDGSGTAYSDGADIAAGRSFYTVSFSVRWNRERYACASLGLTPEGAAFDECVSDLDSSFLPSPN